METVPQLLQSKVVPWTRRDDGSHLIVARAEMNAAALPPGVTLSRRTLKGRRVVLKDRRKHSNQRLHIAEWPEENRHEIALAKLVCIVSGEADYLLENCCLHGGAGNFILIPPRTPHHRLGPFLEGAHLERGACTLLFAYAYSHGVFCWISHSRSTQHTNDMAENYLLPNVAAAQIFNLLAEEAVAGAENSPRICRDLLSAFFTMLARDLEAGRYMHPGPKANRETLPVAASSFAGQVQEYIEANLHNPLRAEQVAAQMYMSLSQFSRRLRQETGTTFIELLMRARVARAQELLRETDWTAIAIAEYVGFKSSAYFQDLFRRRVGCTPIEYRQRDQNAEN